MEHGVKRWAASGSALAIGALWVAALAGAAHPQAAPSPPRQLTVGGRVLGARVAPRAGDRCLIDREPTGPADPVYLVDGQRVALHWTHCYREFLKHPARYEALLKPGGGAFLFSEGYLSEISLGWLLLGLYVLLGLVFAALSAGHALAHGKPAVGAFFAGFFLNAAGYLYVCTRPSAKTGAEVMRGKALWRIPTSYPPEACPRCGAANHPSAKVCAACGAVLTPRIASEVDLAKSGFRARESERHA
jgi:ribosomal protein L37E